MNHVRAALLGAGLIATLAGGSGGDDLLVVSEDGEGYCGIWVKAPQGRDKPKLEDLSRQHPRV